MRTKKYDKLIRDKIPEICLKNGRYPEIRIVKNKKEYIFYLQKKILEEALEIKNEKNINKLKTEIADLLEVIYCLIKVINISQKEIRKIMKEKNKKRGSFKKGIILVRTNQKN